MGLPACRITDQTEHGGVIILGFPQVLIGNLPASRITDMHTCPMFDGPVPHVGGPFILGSPTVLVGMMPQSRVTDQLICVGPPDAAILGEMTVLVGMAGAGGAAGASGGAAAAGVPVAAAPSTTATSAAASPATATSAASPATATSSAAPPTAEAQVDGTTKTAAPAGQALPPIALQQAGWPDLPPENTATFQSVQPATVLPGTTLYAPSDADATGGNAYWSTDPPLPSVSPASAAGGSTGPAANSAANSDAGNASDSQAAADAPSVADWNSGSHVQVATVPPGPGLKVWAGKPAENPQQGMQIWAPPEAMAGAGRQRFRMPEARH